MMTRPWPRRNNDDCFVVIETWERFPVSQPSKASKAFIPCLVMSVYSWFKCEWVEQWWEWLLGSALLGSFPQNSTKPLDFQFHLGDDGKRKQEQVRTREHWSGNPLSVHVLLGELLRWVVLAERMMTVIVGMMLEENRCEVPGDHLSFYCQQLVLFNYSPSLLERGEAK